jgi:hypothetical protein
LDSLFALPYWLLLAILCAGSVAVACGLHALLRRIVAFDKLVEHNDVAGFMIAIVGVLYAVLISFVVVVVWEQYNDADANYAREVSAVADGLAFVRALPPDRQSALRVLFDRYIDEMIDDEWPAMLHEGHSTQATQTLAQLSHTITAEQPRSATESETLTRLQESVQEMFDLRYRRLTANEDTMPAVLWAALLVGAAITVGFGYLFGVRNIRVQLIMTGAVAAMIALMFAVLIELDFPFRRDTAISVDRWVVLRKYIAAARAQTPPPTPPPELKEPR